MPYILKNRREKILNPDAIGDVDCAGDLNYCFSIIINQYLKHKGMNYQTCNDVIGALEGAKMEFYRRVVGNYEDSKITQNGDVY